jgi:amino acid transporter
MTGPHPASGGNLGFGALFAASIGVIVAQLGMVAIMQGIGIAGWGFLVAMGLAFSLALTNAMAYAEMALMMPSAGSLSSYAEAAIGNFPAILLVFAGYVTPAMFGVPVELILANQILREALPLPLPSQFWPVAIVVAFAGLNILGADVFARVQTTLSFTVLAFLLLVGLVAIGGGAAAPLPGAGLRHLTDDPAVLGVVALAFWVFVGSEFVTPLVPEARDARRDLPRAMIGSLVVIFIAQLVFAVGAAMVVPRDQLASSPTPHMDYALVVFGSSARIGIALLALLASASLLNSVLAAVPRMLQGMAQNGQVFPLFKVVSRRYGTPIFAIVFVACLPLIGLAWSGGNPDAILPLTIAASVAWLLAYVLAQVSLIVLRVRRPDAERPYRAPWFPGLQVFAIAGMLFVVSQSSPTPELTAQIVRYTAIVLGLFAVVGATWVKLVMKRGLFESVDPLAPTHVAPAAAR